MHTLDEIAIRIPIRVVQKQRQEIPLEILAEQLHLNGWLDEQLVDHLLKNAKECVITIFSTDYGPEAAISGTAADKTSKTEFPGFYVAEKQADVTIQKELARAADYIARKYLTRVPILDQPVKYHIQSAEPSQQSAIIAVEKETLEVKTEQEYWDEYVAPELRNGDSGRAMHALAEAYQHHRQSPRDLHAKTEAWARNMTMYSLYSLIEMMAQHGRKSVSLKQYKTSNGVYEMDDLEFSTFYDPRITKQIFSGETRVPVPLQFIRKV